MKNCPYCMWEVADEAKKCKYCWEWIVDDKLKEESERKAVSTKKYKFFKRIGVFIIVVFLVCGISLFIKHYKDKQSNIKLANDFFSKEIATNWDADLWDYVEFYDNYIPQTSREERVKSLVLDFLDKIHSFSGDLFFIEDKNLHDITLINLAVNQLKEYKNTMSNYFEEYWKILNEFWLLDNKWPYSYYEALSKMEWFVSQEEKFADKLIEYYDFILTIQDDFYYDESEDKIYFYSSKSSLGKFNTLKEEVYNTTLDTFDVEDDYSNYYIEFLKYRENMYK